MIIEGVHYVRFVFTFREQPTPAEDALGPCVPVRVRVVSPYVRRRREARIKGTRSEQVMQTDYLKQQALAEQAHLASLKRIGELATKHNVTITNVVHDEFIVDGHPENVAAFMNEFHTGSGEF